MFETNKKSIIKTENFPIMKTGNEKRFACSTLQ